MVFIQTLFCCQIDFEHKLRLEGKYDGANTNKVKKNDHLTDDSRIKQWNCTVDQTALVLRTGIKKTQVNE